MHFVVLLFQHQLSFLSLLSLLSLSPYMEYSQFSIWKRHQLSSKMKNCIVCRYSLLTCIIRIDRSSSIFLSLPSSSSPHADLFLLHRSLLSFLSPPSHNLLLILSLAYSPFHTLFLLISLPFFSLLHFMILYSQHYALLLITTILSLLSLYSSPFCLFTTFSFSILLSAVFICLSFLFICFSYLFQCFLYIPSSLFVIHNLTLSLFLIYQFSFSVYILCFPAPNHLSLSSPCLFSPRLVSHSLFTNDLKNGKNRQKTAK